MTIWCVYFKDTCEGAYVAAPTPDKAKEAFKAVYDQRHRVRLHHVKNVKKEDFPSTVVLSPGDPRLAMFGLRYANE
jgi:hypothetical protein